MATSQQVPLTRAQRVRQVGNLMNLSSALGLTAARLGRARLRPGPQGLLLAEGYRLNFPSRAGAFTVGNVILTSTDFESLTAREPHVMDHESAHAWQYFWCGGLPFLPLYALAAGWSWLRTGDLASANFFERNAGLVRGGYREAPITNIGFKRLRGRLQTLIEKPSRLAERSF
ncbi:hypothetical protein [Micropruina glycogenica]|uniref:DUF4157 domain-containing protein n=1 Tax=Micropruina glycogenica TaxID=75385 RepID=A0A2N9JMK5_9ACTN|nr:hypothetical protein [Micropruina glycogenica]SPD88822.1 conserved protein of unknown function [Micropruina glycogenica]